MGTAATTRFTTERAVRDFLAAARRRHVAAHTLLISASTPRRLGYVISGSLEVMLEDADGREIVLAYLGRGEFFGELGFFDPEGPRSAWVRARGRAEIAEMSYERFANLAARDPGITHTVAAQLAQRLARTNGKVRALAFENVAHRIARTLHELCDSPDALTHPEGMQIRISRSDLGKLVGCSREMAGRVVKDFAARGLLRARGKTLVVFDAGRVERERSPRAGVRCAPN
ncbi:MAG: hypothetical protein RL603_2280 [Pseudomonadota bacterium]|jgi:CRP/FNR family cyclic AMP-dependent transcriptional regulator